MGAGRGSGAGDKGEAMLQLRAYALCDDGGMEGIWKRRQAAARGQRRYRRAG